MPTFTAPDGTELAYHLKGDGNPLVCGPGGPMLDSTYLQDLGGLDADRQLVLLDLRGTGDSAVPTDPESTRCDRQVADVEALRKDLSLEREPWYPGAAAAFDRVRNGSATEADWPAIDPFTYGRWDDDVRAYNDWMNGRRNPEAAAGYAEGYDPASTVPALAGLDVPAVVLGGQLDLGNPPGLMADVAAKIPGAEFVVQPGAGHFPWVDDPVAFRELLRPHLS